VSDEKRAHNAVNLTLDLRTLALVHKLMATGIYHARLSQAEFDNARRGQELLENLLLQSNYYSASELRMVLDSTAQIVRVAP
jgi:hypothetical protein